MDSLLNGLDSEQQQAVTYPLGPLRIIAGAGSGKTKTLTHKIAWLHHTNKLHGRHTLTITHSTKAADEIVKRLQDLHVPDVAARTFHSAALRQLRYFWKAAGNPGSGPQILADPEPYIRGALAKAQGITPARTDTETVQALVQNISKAQASLITPDSYLEWTTQTATGDSELDTFIFKQYQDLKVQTNKLDYTDLLIQCRLMLENNPHISHVFHSGYLNFMVDEYQDTDLAQQELLKTWNKQSDNLCLVGDPNQSIYSFKGAQVNLISEVETWLPQVHTIYLQNTYRCAEQIADKANKLAPHTLPAELFDLKIDLQSKRLPTLSSGVHFERLKTAQEEGQYIAQTLVRWNLQGIGFNNAAVLCRTRKQVAQMRKELQAHNLPLKSDGTHLNLESVGVKTIKKTCDMWLAEPHIPFDVLIEEAADSYGYDPQNYAEITAPFTSESDKKTKALGDLVTKVKKWVEQEEESIDIYQRLQTDLSTSSEGVSVLTIHSAKGLEWQGCVIPELSEGMFPRTPLGTKEELAEEYRLFYVALTRAQDRVLLTNHKNPVSRFIEAIAK